MRVVRTFSSKLDADLAKIALDAAGVPAVVVASPIEQVRPVAAATAALEPPGPAST